MFESCLRGFGRCLGGVWEVYGRCSEGVWDGFERCSRGV